MSSFRLIPLLALVAAPVAAATAADIPGGPGTGTTLKLDASLSSDLGSASDADWFRTSLAAGKLYAITVGASLAAGADVRLSVRGPGGRVLRSANLSPRPDPYTGTQQLNYRPRASGTYFISVEVGAPPSDSPLPPFPTPYDLGLFSDASSDFADAVRLPFNLQVRDSLETGNDRDYFVIRLSRGQPVDVISPGDATLFDRNFKVVEDVSYENGKLTYFQPAYTGDYFIRRTGTTGAYTVKVAPATRGTPTPGNDVLFGTGGPDVIDGLAGRDTVRGLGGNDTLLGGLGGDGLYGGPGNDRLNGGQEGDGLSGEDGNDALTGGLGQDFMSGGPGEDRFLFFGDAARGYDAGLEEFGENGRDYLNDFTRGDRVDLRGTDADATLPGRQGFRFIGYAPFSAPGQVRYRFSGAAFGQEVTQILLNTDADPRAESVIQISGRLPLRPGDFILRDPTQAR